MVRLPRFTHRSVDDSTVGAADWVLAGVLVLLSLLAPRTGRATPEPSGPLAAIVVVFALGQGLPVAVRRRYPAPVAVCVLGCYAGQGLLEGVVPPFAPWVLIWSLAAGTGARLDSAKPAVVIAATTCALIGLAEVIRPGVEASALLVLVTIVVALASVLVKSERDRLAALRRRAATEERLRIARDLHDLVGHGLSAVAVQSSTARMALEAGDAVAARAAIRAVESSSRTALGELRQMLGILSDSHSAAPAPGLGDIRQLADNLRAGGVPVEVELAGDLDGVPPATQLGGYRVVQESLTNALKHAAGSHVAVRVVAEPGLLSVAVESRGGHSATPDAEDGGVGLEGLRSRVASLSGELRSNRTPDGWLVHARLPLPQPVEPPGSSGDRA